MSPASADRSTGRTLLRYQLEISRPPMTARSAAEKSVLVTGGASGRGRATAHVFADEGAAVAGTDVTIEGAESTADEVRKVGGTCAAWKLDVRDQAEVRDVVAAVVE